MEVVKTPPAPPPSPLTAWPCARPQLRSRSPRPSDFRDGYLLAMPGADATWPQAGATSLHRRRGPVNAFGAALSSAHVESRSGRPDDPDQPAGAGLARARGDG